MPGIFVLNFGNRLNMAAVFQVLLDEEEENSQLKLRKPRVFKDRYMYVGSPLKSPVVMSDIMCGKRSDKRWLIRAFAVCMSHLRILICPTGKLLQFQSFYTHLTLCWSQIYSQFGSNALPLCRNGDL